MPQVKPMIECCFQYLYFSKSMQFGFRTDLPFVILSCVSNYASNNYQILVQSVRQSKKIVLQFYGTCHGRRWSFAALVLRLKAPNTVSADLVSDPTTATTTIIGFAPRF